jgi:phospholipase C
VGVNGGTVNGRCGPGTRTPFLVISPYARTNYVDGTQITQASVVRFIEDNWLHGERIGQGSGDATTGSIMGMFDFNRRGFDLTPPLFLDPNQGTPIIDKRNPWHS